LELPHRFPFRWLERTGESSGRFLVSANSTWLRGGAALPTPFLAEMVAQTAAVVLQAPESGSRERWLGGIDRLEINRAVQAGDVLEILVVAGRRFGSAVQVAGTISRDGETIGEALLLLV
jgi:3-hydroxymyristoyl/3-hydroxydecanoyl-(acyl carrier protein) dehydratase